MSTFSLPISPPDALQPGFTESLTRLKDTFFLRLEIERVYITERSATTPYGVLSFGSWLEPRYIFAARQLT